MQEIVTAISTLGFPIASCIFVGWYVYRQNENYRADIKELQAAHKEEIDKLSKAVNKLCDKLDDLLNGGRCA